MPKRRIKNKPMSVLPMFHTAPKYRCELLAHTTLVCGYFTAMIHKHDISLLLTDFMKNTEINMDDIGLLMYLFELIVFDLDYTKSMYYRVGKGFFPKDVFIAYSVSNIVWIHRVARMMFLNGGEEEKIIEIIKNLL